MTSSPATSHWAEHALQTLEQAGYRSGTARRAVVEVLAEQRCCLSAREIGDTLAAEGGSVGLASIYRALEALDRLGLVRRLDAGEGLTRYEPADPSGAHHHHVVCDRCGRVASFSDERLEDAISRIGARIDFDVAGHDVVLRGACPGCRDAQARG